MNKGLNFYSYGEKRPLHETAESSVQAFFDIILRKAGADLMCGTLTPSA